MRILSVRQPFAHLIVHGIKPIENRTWNTPYRGLILIHASARPDREPFAEVSRRLRVKIDPEQLQYGGIVGVATLVDVVAKHRSRFATGPWCWVLSDARPLPFVQMHGRLGLWTAPRAVLDAVAEQVMTLNDSRR